MNVVTKIDHTPYPAGRNKAGRASRSILQFVNWHSYLWAGLLATIAKFSVYALTGNEPLAAGADLLPDADPVLQNVAAALAFLLVTYLFYGMLYVVFLHNASHFRRSRLADRLTKAVVAGFAMAFVAVVSMPWFFTVAYSGPHPEKPGISEEWSLLPWQYGVFWEYMLIYLAFALVMVFVYKSPTE